MAQAQQQDPIFSEENKVKSQFIKWGKPGNWFKGTLLDVREVDDQFHPGEKNKIYEFRIHAGEFNDIDEEKKAIDPAIKLEEGDIYAVGGKKSIDSSMRNVKIGTIVGMRFKESVPSKTKGYGPAKIIETFVGGQDPNYMGEGSENLPSFE